jgi:hypothetical protein
MLRHLLVISECGGERITLDMTSDEVKALSEMAGRTDATALHRMFSLWYGVAEQISRSSFPKMTLEVGLIRLARIGPVKPIGEIIAKLDSLIGDGTTPLPAPKRRPPAPSPRPDEPAAKPEGHHTLTFEAADVEGERKWQGFMRWLASEKPQAAAILSQGSLEAIGPDAVKVRFDNPHFADMQAEEDRLRTVEKLMTAYFKRPTSLSISRDEDAGRREDRPRKKDELVKEALSDDIVRKAADILGAKLHDVKVEKA